MSWVAEVPRKSRKILEGLAAILNSLKMSSLEFQSPNTTSQVQPVDVGVTSNLKTYIVQSW
jgi:hypothetical protein